MDAVRRILAAVIWPSSERCRGLQRPKGSEEPGYVSGISVGHCAGVVGQLSRAGVYQRGVLLAATLAVMPSGQLCSTDVPGSKEQVSG